jgi:hypothetical protein
MTTRTLPEVNCKYGAPMGRTGTHCADVDIPFKFYLQHIRLDSGGYDSGGAYWGQEGPLYQYYTDYPDGFEGETSSSAPEDFIRAADREQAKEIIRKDYPLARFFR